MGFGPQAHVGGKETKDRSYLDQAIRGYERGFYLRNDYYNGINYAFLLNERAVHGADFAESIADFSSRHGVSGSRLFRSCEQWLRENTKDDGKERHSAKVQRESLLGPGHHRRRLYIGLEDGKGEQALNKAFAAATADWIRETTEKQVKTLKELLANSPLKKLPTVIAP